MTKDVFCITAAELSEKGWEHAPADLITTEHMIYSSPATIAFNSPGAQGFGVKRAGLAVPGSVMLLVAPGCCGRNTTLLTEVAGYENRFFYQLMDEADLVTGRHLTMIPEAVKEIVESLSKRPSCVMICITCVDALLGTDMDRVCRKAEEAAGVPVQPCYMYALTREGRKPPMVHVRQSIYELLNPLKKVSTTVNILGYFSPLEDDSEIYTLLKSIGVKTINEISRCPDYEAYLNMASANFNLVLNPEARLAGQDLEKRLGIPMVEMARMYQIDKIENQYKSLAAVLGAEFDDEEFRLKAQATIDAFTEKWGGISIAIGELMNANSFELALAMTKYGLKVKEIYGNPVQEDMAFINKLAELSPDTKIYANLSPTMLNYDSSTEKLDLTIGKDAGYYHASCPNVMWWNAVQPFGYEGLRHLFEEMSEAMERGVC